MANGWRRFHPKRPRIRRVWLDLRVPEAIGPEFGWTRAQTSLGYTAIALSSALFGVAWGFIADRLGTRWFGVVAALVMAASLFLLSGQTSIVHFYAFYFLTALSATRSLAPRYLPTSRIGLSINPAWRGALHRRRRRIWSGRRSVFRRHHDRVFWVARNLRLHGLNYLIIALPLGFPLFVNHHDGPKGVTISERPKQLSSRSKKRRSFFGYRSLCFFFCNCMSVPIVHLVPLLTDAGRSLSTATGILMVPMFSGTIGRILGGKLCDVLGPLAAYY
ncbi:MAG: hypothetical protein CM1200mP9_11130 [Gammaproteobacteria bacterium]|nr:MAG: hypothetical protein CM1200mP9_11130 [Gammaproteobacteria bacterium]